MTLAADGPSRYQAVLLDVDGTLVDTTYLHTIAWWRALADAGHHRPMADIHPLIGMGSSELLERLLGHDDAEVSNAHGEHFTSMHPWIRPLPGARQLLEHLHRLGHTVVLASSAKERDRDALLGSLEADRFIDQVVLGDEVDAAKPAPDLFEVALARAGAPPERAMAVGDAVWDVTAAGRAGVSCVGLLTGGIDQRILREAGAVAVYPSCRELRQAWTGGVLTGDGKG